MARMVCAHAGSSPGSNGHVRENSGLALRGSGLGDQEERGDWGARELLHIFRVGSVGAVVSTGWDSRIRAQFSRRLGLKMMFKNHDKEMGSNIQSHSSANHLR